MVVVLAMTENYLFGNSVFMNKDSLTTSGLSYCSNVILLARYHEDLADPSQQLSGFPSQ